MQSDENVLNFKIEVVGLHIFGILGRSRERRSGIMRIAIATKDGEQVNDCVLTSTRWWIYEIGQTTTVVEQRDLRDSCQNNCGMCCDHLLSVLHDCDLLLAKDIDANTTEYLLSHGKQLMRTRMPVKRIVNNVTQAFRTHHNLDYFRRLNDISRIYG